MISILKKFIVIILIAIILIVIGILAKRFIFQSSDIFHTPLIYNNKDCIIEELEEIKPNQELCVDYSNFIPTKVYYSDGWKVVCCKGK